MYFISSKLAKLRINLDKVIYFEAKDSEVVECIFENGQTLTMNISWEVFEAEFLKLEHARDSVR